VSQGEGATAHVKRPASSPVAGITQAFVDAYGVGSEQVQVILHEVDGTKVNANASDRASLSYEQIAPTRPRWPVSGYAGRAGGALGA
jgi:hypothetical protein